MHTNSLQEAEIPECPICLNLGEGITHERRQILVADMEESYNRGCQGCNVLLTCARGTEETLESCDYIDLGLHLSGFPLGYVPPTISMILRSGEYVIYAPKGKFCRVSLEILASKADDPCQQKAIFPGPPLALSLMTVRLNKLFTDLYDFQTHNQRKLLT